MSKTLHLMTQRGQPYGSTRKCCEVCGLMLVARDKSFWDKHAWTDDEGEYEPIHSNEHHGSFMPCNQAKGA